VSETIQVPASLFKKFLRASEALSELHEAWEDYLISTNPTLLRKLRAARREHVAGRTHPLGDLRRELNLSPSARASTREPN
jgi:hypothetical protein